MAAMPAMDEGKDKPKKGIDLAIVFGKPKGKGAPSGGPEPDGDEAPGMAAESESQLPEGFEDAASEAFPEMAGDTERMGALKRLIHLCTNSY